MNGGPSQRIALRRSAASYLATPFFIAVAAAAVWTTLAPRFGVGHASIGGFAVFAILCAAASRHARDQPDALKIGPEGLTVWNRAGILRAEGRIAGCSQWSDTLLMLWLEDESGRVRRIIIEANRLERDAFREFAVLARRAAQV